MLQVPDGGGVWRLVFEGKYGTSDPVPASASPGAWEVTAIISGIRRDLWTRTMGGYFSV